MFAIIPLCHNVVVLAVVMAVAGLAMGCIDTISNMQLVKIYQKDSAIFLQVRAGPSPPWAGLGWTLGGISSQKGWLGIGAVEAAPLEVFEEGLAVALSTVVW